MNIHIESADLLTFTADLVAVAVNESNMTQRLSALDAAFDGALLDALSRDDFKAKAGATATYPSFGKVSAQRLLVVGIGNGTGADVKLAAGAAGQAARRFGAAGLSRPGGDGDRRRQRSHRRADDAPPP